MQRATLLKACKSIAFILVLCLVLNGFFSVFRFKYGDGIYSLDKFYELEKDTVDVLVLGSSHAFEAINPAILYYEYGIAAFDLCGSQQPLWNTYHYLVEALKTQTPKLVILEAYSACVTEPYLDNKRVVKNNFGFKPSRNLVESLLASAPAEQFWEYFFRFYYYHNRYNGDLQRQDFSKNLGQMQFVDWKGFGANYNWYSFEKPEVDISGTLPLAPKTEEYYRKIIELCMEKDIPLEIVISPYMVDSTALQRFHRAAEIAEEYGVPFTNYNSDEWFDEVEFDFSSDMADAGHLNHRGHTKYTLSLGEYLYDTYDLPDRRNEEKWLSWERNAEYYYQSYDLQMLREQLSFPAFLECLAYSSDYTIIISATGDCSSEAEEICSQLNDYLGIECDATDIHHTWVLRDLEVIQHHEPGMKHPFIQLDDINIDFSQGDRFRVNGADICKENGVNILVYSHATQTYLDGIFFDAEDNLAIRLLHPPEKPRADLDI